MASKRKAAAMVSPQADEPIDPADELMFLALGGGNEVGRSSHIIQYKGKTVMLDAGQHPAYDGLAALPFFDDFDLSTVDVLLISHFHVDHAASLPYVLSKTNFRGRVFMTHPTKAIYKWLIQDSVRVGNTSSNPTSQPVYTEQDHLNTFPQIEAIDYHTTHTISSIRITPYPAGHVLGAAMFLIEIAGLKIFFTGDYSREQDRHLVSAEVPKGIKIDVLITESTYGVASHVPRLEREQALMKSVTSILNRGGRVLMPVFALGRAQELLLILDEYWGKHAEFQKVPIYYASNLARKCMLVYQTYVSAMNDNIKRLFRERMAEAEATGSGAGKGGPWDFKYVRSLKNLDRFEDIGGCVMLASPGMLQNGVSRELLERWAPSDKNGVVITGYSVEGTMAKQIMQEPDQIQAVSSRYTHGARRAPGGETDKVMIPRRCSVQEYSFAAHVDGVENREFIEEIAAPHVILVHGEQHNMMRLKSKLLSLNANKTNKVKIYSPRNCEELRIHFRADKTAKVVGKLAGITVPVGFPGVMSSTTATESTAMDVDTGAGDNSTAGNDNPKSDQEELVTGVLVQNDFKMSLMAAEDLREYAGLTTTTITCRQKLRLTAAGIDLIRWALEGTFGVIEELPEMSKKERAENDGEDSKMEDVDGEVAHLVASYLVMGCITVRYKTDGEVELEWEGNMLNDGIADSVMAVLVGTESSPAAVKRSASKTPHSHSPPPFPSKTSPHSHLSPTENLERLFLFLEAQFGTDAVRPVAEPKLPPYSPTPPAALKPVTTTTKPGKKSKSKTKPEAEGGDSDASMSLSSSDSDDSGSNTSPDTKAEAGAEVEPEQQEEEESPEAIQARLQTQELSRLHKIGIPVPGVEIKVDKMRAVVWLEDLEVECANKIFGDRVRAVIERSVEVGAPLWKTSSAGTTGGIAGGGGGGI